MIGVGRVCLAVNKAGNTWKNDDNLYDSQMVHDKELAMGQMMYRQYEVIMRKRQ